MSLFCVTPNEQISSYVEHKLHCDEMITDALY